MLNISTGFKWNKTPEQIKSDLGFNNDFNLFCANTAWVHMCKFTPRQEGALMETVNISSDKKAGYIEYAQPYARKMYTGDRFSFRQDVNEFATSYWDKAMMNVMGEQYARECNNARARFSR